MSMINCPNCQQEISSNAESCPHCGEPINQKPAKKKKGGKGIIAIVIALIVVAALVCGGIFIGNYYNDKVYKQNMKEATLGMLASAINAENAGNLLSGVWHNSISKVNADNTDKFTKDANGKFYDDFNTALDNLYADADFQKAISDLHYKQLEITDIMKALQNPSDKNKEGYTAVKALYTEYIKLTDLIISCGENMSYNEFSEKFSEYDSKSSEAYKEAAFYIEIDENDQLVEAQ